MKNLLAIIILFCGFLSYSQEKNSEEIKVVELDDNSTEVPFAIIEKAPVYKGCNENTDNRVLKKCMSDGITKHVLKKFNIDVVKNLGLEDGMVRISVIFKIDKEGKIVGAKARAPHPKLEEETLRVVNLIPQLERAGYQKGKPVIVPYSLPIIFNVDNSKYLSRKELRKLKKKKN